MSKFSYARAFRPIVLQGGSAATTSLNSEGRISYLRIVPQQSACPVFIESNNDSNFPFVKKEQQLAFRLLDPASLVIVNMLKIQSSGEFSRLLKKILPSVIFDVRPCPILEIDHLMDRQGVFALFRSIAARYHDVTGKLNIETSDDARLNPAWMGRELSQILSRQAAKGTVAILVNGEQRASDYEAVLPHYLKPAPKGGWLAASHTNLIC